MKCTLHEHQYTFFIMSRSFLLRMRNVSKNVEEKIEIDIRRSVTLFFLTNHAFHVTMWKNTIESGRPHMLILRMRMACWVFKATHTHLDYVILIACPLQQLLHERAAMLIYTYIAFLVFFSIILQILQKHFHLHVNLIRRTSGQSLINFK